MSIGWKSCGLGAPVIAMAAALLFVACMTTPGRAQDDPFENATSTGISPFVGATETWLGGEGTGRAWALYTGFNWAPSGLLSDDGWRVRVTGGSARYDYRTYRDDAPLSIYGTAAFSDLLVGYQVGLGDVTLKALAGLNFDGHYLSEKDLANPVNGPATGVKAVVEAWWNVTQAVWSSLDVSASSSHSTYTARVRLGYRVWEGLSVGAEGGGFGNEASDSRRAGGLVRYEWAKGEVSASAGATRGVKGTSFEGPTGAYGTLVYLSRF